jgi:D-alanyl-lipoteichoic acid acyltransferase DltB (MBOAT superfamily)
MYCDFSGYTDVARGTARTMGFELMRNFDLPYFATNPSDFWRRWHISLSTWLRDYLYLPLGGNRKGPARTYVNLMLTMVLGGLWHGAAWTFVLWGAFHGALLCLHRFARPWLERWADPRGPIASRAWFFLRALVFFQLVCFGWLLFRANSLAQVGQMLGAIGRSLTVDANVLGPSVLAVFIACAAVLLLVQLVQFVSKNHDVIWRLPVPVRAALYAVGILAFVLFGEFGGEAFIYFQF